MIKRAKETLFAFAILALASRARAQLRLDNVNVEPEIFSDQLLDVKERDAPGRQLIDGLGLVRMLSTRWAPSPAENMHTRFDIINKRKETKNILYDNDSWSKLVPFGELKGPYQYQLELLAESEFDINTKTIVMIPGYRSPAEDDWIIEARQLWLELEPDADIIQISWTDSNHGLYDRVVANTVIIARQLTIFLHYLLSLSNSSLKNDRFLSNIHIIGHSLGAHIAGFVGQDLGGRLGRITGLDPAGPSFDQFEASQRLSPDDAKLVIVIHTNSGTIKYLKMAMMLPLAAICHLPGFESVRSAYSGEADTSWFGIDMNLGHLDYNANNGRMQPGCEGLLHICDHIRALEIYNAILKHEVNVRKEIKVQFANLAHNEQRKLLRSSRLVAFKAESFDSFANGQFATQSCDQLIRFADEKLNRYEYERAYNSCTIPLDLVTPVDELIEELQIERKIINQPNPIESKFYFRTLDYSAAVGDQWMIKIKLEHAKSSWEDAHCALQAHFDLVTEQQVVEETTLEITKLESIIERRHPMGITLVHGTKPMSKLLMTKLVGMIRKGDHKKESSEQPFKDLVGQIIPQRISLKIARTKSPSFIGAIRDATLKMMEMDGSAAECKLQINQLEVQLVGEPTISGIYQTTSDDDEKTGYNESLHSKLALLSHKEYGSPERKLAQLSLGTLSISSRTTLSLSIYGVVIKE